LNTNVSQSSVANRLHKIFNDHFIANSLLGSPVKEYRSKFGGVLKLLGAFLDHPIYTYSPLTML